MSINSHCYHRHSVRLVGYDYSSPGAYFVTIATFEHLCTFGKIISSVMMTNDLGKIIEECWYDIPDHFPNTEILSFVVMPNHIHGIISIHEEASRGTIHRAPTTEKFGKPVAGSIPTMIRTYKAATSRQARQDLGIVKIWQRNYYEHIIRNQIELENVARYIVGNPQSWVDDLDYQIT